MNADETVLWEGCPSQWTNFLWFASCILILPIPIALWKWLVTRCFNYRVTTERIVITQGVFSKRTDELELYRVKDTTLLQPFWLRLVGRSHVQLATSDRTTPMVQLTAIPDGSALREQLRVHVERLRVAKGLREMDVGEVAQ